MAEHDDIPDAPAGRPDLAKTWALVAELEKNSDKNYQMHAKRIRDFVAAFSSIGLAELADIHRFIDAELKQLEVKQNAMLYRGLSAAVVAARLGLPKMQLNEHAEKLLIDALIHTTMKDGLNLSSRLWRIHAGAAQDMKSIVDVAVQRGWSAEKAVQHAMDISPELRQALAEAGSDAVAKRLEQGLLHDSNNARMKFRRVLRTEINRAHGERYKQMVREDDEAVGVRFCLSPRHPRRDICDTHASADLYDLGAGVYPVDACPWPAHPNTFSYVEVVYRD